MSVFYCSICVFFWPFLPGPINADYGTSRLVRAWLGECAFRGRWCITESPTTPLRHQKTTPQHCGQFRCHRQRSPRLIDPQTPQQPARAIIKRLGVDQTWGALPQHCDDGDWADLTYDNLYY
eukprot:scaffold82362_cov65-Phaeocystis_antarctica.AAC.2